MEVDRDLGSPIDVANVAASNIAPLVVGIVVKGLKYTNILLHFGQLLPLNLHGRLILCCLLRVLALWLHLQRNNFPSQNVGIRSVATNGGLDLVNSALESMESGKSNMLGRCPSTLELIVDGGVLAENVAVTNSKDLGTGGATLALVLMKEQRNTSRLP